MQGTYLALPIRWRWKFERIIEQLQGLLGGGKKEPPRPRLCPSCGTLVGASASKCHQCGASMTYSLAAASRSLGGVFKSDAPVTYVILLVTCALFGFSLMATIRAAGEFTPPSGGIMGLFNLGAISGAILDRLGASLPLADNLHQPWRFIMAVFLHGSILHIGFNMWVIMDVGPQIEELYGSARYLFIYVSTGAFAIFSELVLWTFQRRGVGCAARADRGYDGVDHRAAHRGYANAAVTTDSLADLYRGDGIYFSGDR